MSLSFRFHLVVCFSTASIGGCPSDTKKSYLATGPNFGDKLRLQPKVCSPHRLQLSKLLRQILQPSYRPVPDFVLLKKWAMLRQNLSSSIVGESDERYSEGMIWIR
jgi:hypothetical protein